MTFCSPLSCVGRRSRRRKKVMTPPAGRPVRSASDQPQTGHLAGLSPDPSDECITLWLAHALCGSRLDAEVLAKLVVGLGGSPRAFPDRVSGRVIVAAAIHD